MLVFWTEKLVLFSTPKTGSTSLEMALRPRAGLALTDPPVAKHTPVYRYQRFLVPYFEVLGGRGFETVAVVREPVDWLGSWWRYRQREDLKGHPNSTAEITFDEFVRGYLREGKQRPGFASVGSQAKFLQDKDGRIGIDHLFRYEDQPALHAFLAERLGPLPAFKRLNESPKREVTLRPRLAERLRAERAEEFDAWSQARSS